MIGHAYITQQLETIVAVVVVEAVEERNNVRRAGEYPDAVMDNGGDVEDGTLVWV
jgi:hypothetical protein